MRPIVTYIARLCVTALYTRVSCAKTAEPIEMLFGEADSRRSKEPCNRWGPDAPRKWALLRGTYSGPWWRKLRIVRLPLRKNVPAQPARGDQTVMRPLPKLLLTLVFLVAFNEENMYN